MCRNGGTCVFSPGGSPQCVCPLGRGGLDCQLPTRNPCESHPCYNGGTCESAPTEPFYRCRCPRLFNGLQCFILDYEFGGGSGQDITLPPNIDLGCEKPQCARLATNRVCEARCNTHACDWDGGDCSLNFNDPWKNCSHALQCWRYFGDGKCDEHCNNAGCLYDGFDCQSVESQCK